MSANLTPSWISLAELARRRGVSYEAVRRWVKRCERQTGRNIVVVRIRPDASGRERSLRGVDTTDLMCSVRNERGETPMLPEVQLCNQRIDFLVEAISRIESTLRRAGFNL